MTWVRAAAQRDRCVARRQRCHRIASSSRLALAMQAPCARPLLILGQAPSIDRLTNVFAIWILNLLYGSGAYDLLGGGAHENVRIAGPEVPEGEVHVGDRAGGDRDHLIIFGVRRAWSQPGRRRQRRVRVRVRGWQRRSAPVEPKRHPHAPTNPPHADDPSTAPGERFGFLLAQARWCVADGIGVRGHGVAPVPAPCLSHVQPAPGCLDTVPPKTHRGGAPVWGVRASVCRQK